MLRIGIIGYGYWGPNLVRNFADIDGATVTLISDTNEAALKRAQAAYPMISVTPNDYDVILSPTIDAVAIATPVSTHYPLAKRALENGKHVFVEKPFTTSAQQAEELIELADRKSLKIMVDHTFLFTGAVKKIKQLIDDGVLGRLFYFDSIRINLGLLQKDSNVIWDLAPHDLSIMDYLIGCNPIAIAATGTAHINGFEDVAYVTIYYPDNLIAHLSINWLSPVKIRMTMIGGQKKMLVWNDLEADEKLKIYDRGVEVETKEESYHARINYRSGDVWVPRLEQVEALKTEAQYFADCIYNNLTAINDGVAGLRIVKILEAIIQSLKTGGCVICLEKIPAALRTVNLAPA
ncbi:MAG: Gfo/Idh/MocA family oxidoreductase [Deltaproteobacteria bacterium]|nr:Gfo/Idh/MocA family oxidoreductase [Deltaproteobacteria bacterium]TLN00824.1 MAG: Gfo/Idh/MocA family oxidoreductase [bacterium]